LLKRYESSSAGEKYQRFVDINHRAFSGERGRYECK
jgi:hypothetical protein